MKMTSENNFIFTGKVAKPIQVYKGNEKPWCPVTLYAEDYVDRDKNQHYAVVEFFVSGDNVAKVQNLQLKQNVVFKGTVRSVVAKYYGSHPKSGQVVTDKEGRPVHNIRLSVVDVVVPGQHVKAPVQEEPPIPQEPQYTQSQSVDDLPF